MSEQNSPTTIEEYLNKTQAEFLEENKDQLGSATLGVIEAQREGGAKYNPLRNDQVFNEGTSSKFFGNIPSSIDLDIDGEYNIDDWNVSLDKIKKAIDNARNIGGLAYTDDDIANRYKGNAYTENEEEFVSPWKNINDKNYSEVREEDFLASANNSSNMQFTINNTSDLKAYLRLIMPMYKRSVEVEDLNRNFWVIGNVLTYLCDFLFENKSPYANVLNSLLSEISQLWDNILYLWQALWETEKKIVTDVQTIILPINGIEDEEYDNIKFDNFNNISIDKKTLKNVAKYFAEDDYDTTTLPRELCDSVEKQVLKVINSCPINSCIVPVFRVNNYKHNYYSGEYIIGVFVHDVNFDKSWDFMPLKKINPNEEYFILGMDLSEEQEQIDFKCLREEETQYKIMDSFNGSIYSEERGYYALVRSKINFKAYYENRDNGPNIVPEIMSRFWFYDIVPELYNSHPETKKDFAVTGVDDSWIKIIEGSSSELTNQETEENQEVEENQDVEENQETEENNDEDFIKIVNIERGFYQGELLSYMKPPAEYNVDINQIMVLPVNCPYEVLQNVFYGQGTPEPGNAYNYNDNYMFSSDIPEGASTSAGDAYVEDYGLDPRNDSFLSYFQSYANGDPDQINIDTINEYLEQNPLSGTKMDEFIIHEATNKGNCHNLSNEYYNYSNDSEDVIKLTSIIDGIGEYNFTIKIDGSPKIYKLKTSGSRCIPLGASQNDNDPKRLLEWEIALFDESVDDENAIRYIRFEIEKTTNLKNTAKMCLTLKLAENKILNTNNNCNILLKDEGAYLTTNSNYYPHFYTQTNSYFTEEEIKLIGIERYINFEEISDYISDQQDGQEEIISEEFMKIVKIFLIPPYSLGEGKVHEYNSSSFLVARKIDCRMQPSESSYTAILYPPQVLMNQYNMKKVIIRNYNRSYCSSALTYGEANKKYTWTGEYIKIEDISNFTESGFEYFKNPDLPPKTMSCTLEKSMLNPRHPSKTLVLIKKGDSYVKKNNWILIHIEATILTRVRRLYENDIFKKYLLCNQGGNIYVEDEGDGKDTWSSFGIITGKDNDGQIKYQRKDDEKEQNYYCANYFSKVKNNDETLTYTIRYTGHEDEDNFKNEIVGFHLAGYNINVFKIKENDQCDYYNRHVDRVWTDDSKTALKWKNSFIGITNDDDEDTQLTDENTQLTNDDENVQLADDDEAAQLAIWEGIFTNIMRDYKVLNEETGIPEYFYKNKPDDEKEYYEYFCEDWGLKK